MVQTMVMKTFSLLKLDQKFHTSRLGVMSNASTFIFFDSMLWVPCSLVLSLNDNVYIIIILNTSCYINETMCVWNFICL